MTSAERLQILNLAPTGAVVIHAVVDDCEERLDQDAVDEIVALSTGMLGARRPDQAAA